MALLLFLAVQVTSPAVGGSEAAPVVSTTRRLDKSGRNNRLFVESGDWTSRVT